MSASEPEQPSRALVRSGAWLDSVGLEPRSNEAKSAEWEVVGETVDLDAKLWKVGDIVTRDGSDEQEILDIDGGDPSDLLLVRCVKEPPIYEGGTEPWCRLGEEESNLVGRYSFVRGGGGGGARRVETERREESNESSSATRPK